MYELVVSFFDGNHFICFFSVIVANIKVIAVTFQYILNLFFHSWYLLNVFALPIRIILHISLHANFAKFKAQFLKLLKQYLEQSPCIETGFVFVDLFDLWLELELHFVVFYLGPLFHLPLVFLLILTQPILELLIPLLQICEFLLSNFIKKILPLILDSFLIDSIIVVPTVCQVSEILLFLFIVRIVLVLIIFLGMGPIGIGVIFSVLIVVIVDHISG